MDELYEFLKDPDSKWEYCRGNKEVIITEVLDILAKNGYNAVLKNKENGHIWIKTDLNVVISYYPTTGTIAGYDWNQHRGIESVLAILNRTSKKKEQTNG